MKHLSLSILILIILCTENEKSNQGNLQLVKEYYKAINMGNINNAKDIVTEDFIKINNDKIFEETGIDLFVHSIENHKKDNKEYKFIIEDIFGSNDRVCVRWSWESINIKSGMEKKVLSQGIAIFEIKNKKIDKLWQGFDLLGFTRQLSAN